MPELLDYASPQTNSRRERNFDQTVVVFASVQFCGWALAITDPGEPVMGTEQASLFAWAWRFTQGYSCIGVIISAASMFVLIVATFPAEKRFGQYRAYLIAISFLVVSYSLVLWYLVSQMPGAFATMLQANDPAIAAVMLIVRQPVYWILLLRLILPRMKLEGR